MDMLQQIMQKVNEQQLESFKSQIKNTMTRK